MKIRIVSRPISPPWDSGSMNMAYGIGTNLSKGYHVEIPVVDDFRSTKRGVTSVPIYSSKDFNLFQKIRLVNYLFFRYKPDVLHFFFKPSLVTSIIVSSYLKFINVPSVLTVTHMSQDSDNPKVFGSKVVVYSQYHAKMLRRNGIENVVHISPGVDLAEIKPGMYTNFLENRFGISSDKNVVLFAGEYGDPTDLVSLLDAVRISCNEKKDLYFIFACRVRRSADVKGKEYVEKYLREHNLEDRVKRVGHVPNLHKFISNSNVCILPIRNTYGKVDIPIFLLEAMAFTKPIVITDVAPMNEVLDEPVGISAPLGNAKLLAEAIFTALDNETELGNHGRRLVEKKYSLEFIAEKYEEIYKGLL